MQSHLSRFLFLNRGLTQKCVFKFYNRISVINYSLAYCDETIKKDTEFIGGGGGLQHTTLVPYPHAVNNI